MANNDDVRAASCPTASEAIDYARLILAETGIRAIVHGTLRDEAAGARDVLYLKEGTVRSQRLMVWRGGDGMLMAV